MLQLGNKKIVIATHIYATGPALDLRDYLNNQKTGKVLFIGHPLFYDEKLKGSGYEVYEQGEKVFEKYAPLRKIPAVVSYFKDIFLNIYYVFRFNDRWDLYVGNDPLNAVSGILMKKLGRVKKVAYYVIDYNPKRFANSTLNTVYHKLDQFCVRHSDVTWNLSPRMAEGRKKYFGFEDGNQVVMPIGMWYERFPRLPFEEIEPHTLAFLGIMLKKQGVQYVIDAIPTIIKEIPNFKLLVIGGGEYLETLQKKTTDMQLEKYVQFTGFIKNHEDVERMLVRCAAAVAMYAKYEDNGDLTFTYFADPGKLKSYLASGLPILLSDVSYNAQDIAARRCGFVIEPTPESIAAAVISLMKDQATLREYRDNAAQYASEYDWNVIFQKALENLL